MKSRLYHFYRNLLDYMWTFFNLIHLAGLMCTSGEVRRPLYCLWPEERTLNLRRVHAKPKYPYFFCVNGGDKLLRFLYKCGFPSFFCFRERGLSCALQISQQAHCVDVNESNLNSSLVCSPFVFMIQYF